jgi:hypothetical protein
MQPEVEKARKSAKIGEKSMDYAGATICRTRNFRIVLCESHEHAKFAIGNHANNRKD